MKEGNRGETREEREELSDCTRGEEFSGQQRNS
jgi:hypothetical protein